MSALITFKIVIGVEQANYVHLERSKKKTTNDDQCGNEKGLLFKITIVMLITRHNDKNSNENQNQNRSIALRNPIEISD